ncbi:hypothetical protein [Solwaraspora sp. WMMA2065]|uniref:hypothetical protein n=1 Tax=Solwaraspora sp. WMMA2065 TaxID=3015166 RepID=UPI00259B9BAD|nr:hypothetical protein [Solwaraspora sp. WMMA2065]WJK36826.1 hypothetical protein O7610_11030 [Solwaraspora sp. WMMA2065]
MLTARGVAAAPDGDPQGTLFDAVAAMRNRPDADVLAQARETLAGHAESVGGVSGV